MNRLVLLFLLVSFLSCTFSPIHGKIPALINLDTLPDGRSLFDLSPKELKLFSDSRTRSFVTGANMDITLSLGERLYMLGTMLTAASPSLKLIKVSRAFPGLTRIETGITQHAKKLLNSKSFKNGIRGMQEGKNSETVIDGVKVVFQADGPFSGFTLFGENGFVIGREALRSGDEIAKTVLHECYRLSTSAARSHSGVSQAMVTQETNNVVNFVERAFKFIRP